MSYKEKLESLKKQVLCREVLRVKKNDIPKLSARGVDFTVIGGDAFVDDSDAEILDSIGVKYRRESVHKEDADELPKEPAVDEEDDVEELNKNANYDTGLIPIEEKIDSLKSKYTKKR